MPFFWILIDFSMNFSLFKSRKRGELTASGDMVTGGWHGARDHLEVRRDTEAMWQSPGGPREAQVALTRGRRPHGRVHVGARVGRHVAGRLADGGPTG